MRNTRLATTGVVCAITVLVASYGVSPGYHKVTREEQTRGVLNSVIDDIEDYAAQHHRLPDKLSDLPPHPLGTDNGWGKPLVYEPQADGTAVLRSVGERDGNDTTSIRFSIIDKNNRQYNTPSRVSDSSAMNITFINFEWQDEGIRQYVAEHHRLPDSLADLKYPSAPPERLISDLKDGWGWPVSYTPRGDGTVLLRSGGRDGKQIFSREFTVSGIEAKGPTTEPSTAPSLLPGK
jgi:hypothetical protein